jgi:hypothetical protein
MRLFRNFLLMACMLKSFLTLAQTNKYTVSGTIRDNTNGETMIGATVIVLQDPKIGTACNEYGFYSLNLVEGKYDLVYNFVGYKSDTVKIVLNKDVKQDVGLNLEVFNEVMIYGEKDDQHIRNTNIGTDHINIEDIKALPSIGEVDILKPIQLKPGVKSAGEGNSGFSVRGGSSDQNLILLDEAPVYNASHLLGFFSTFNSDAIKDFTLIKGNSPAQYGGRLSSVLDVKMKEGNNKRLGVTGGIGLISSRLSIEAPIQKDRSSFIISGRRTYADLFLKATEDFKDNKLYFYDLNTKANYQINENNRIFLSGYFGRDVLGFGDSFGIDWGNATGTVRWNSILNPKLFSNTSLIYSDYNYNIKINSGGGDFNINSQITDWNLKEEFQFFPNNKNSMRFGINVIHHDLTPSRFEGEAVSQEVKESRKALDNALFINNATEISPVFKIEYGLRASSYTVLGGDVYNIYERGILQDSVVLDEGKWGKTYYTIEPRFQFSYLLNEKSSIKGGFARNSQHLHLLSNSTSATPTDQWIGNSYNIKPEISDQVSLGYFLMSKKNNYQFSLEGYYKDLQNQVDYKNGADINSAPDVESELLFGIGRAYGVEALIEKKTGKFTGWFGYTLSRTERKIEGINNNDWYVAKQDRTHELSVVGMYKLNERWNLSGIFVYYTGNAVTFPSGKYSIEDQTVYYYTERNGYRMPAYHRLDFAATYTKPIKKRFESSWNFSLYNVYGRENAYTITFEDDPNNEGQTRAIQTSLFKWVPSVTYNFKF